MDLHCDSVSVRPYPSLYAIQFYFSMFSIPGEAYVSHCSCFRSTILLMTHTPHFGHRAFTNPALFLNPIIFSPQLRQCRIIGFHSCIQGIPPFPFHLNRRISPSLGVGNSTVKEEWLKHLFLESDSGRMVSNSMFPRQLGQVFPFYYRDCHTFASESLYMDDCFTIAAFVLTFGFFKIQPFIEFPANRTFLGRHSFSLLCILFSNAFHRIRGDMQDISVSPSAFFVF